MLTKTDLKSIKDLVDNSLNRSLDPVKKVISFIKQDVTGLKHYVSGLKTDVSVLKHDVSGIKDDLVIVKKDIKGMKYKLNDFASLTLTALKNILDWTQDIHETIVKEKLPQRMEKLEKTLSSS